MIANQRSGKLLNKKEYLYEADKLKGLVEKASRMFLQVKQELLAFADFIEQATHSV